jgi:hypothetical protein
MVRLALRLRVQGGVEATPQWVDSPCAIRVPGDTATSGARPGDQSDGTSGGQLVPCDAVLCRMVASQRVRGLEMFGGVTTATLGAEMKALFRATGSARGPGPRRRRAGREGTHEPRSGQDAGPVQERVVKPGWATHTTRRLESRHRTGLAQSGRPAEFAVARDRPWQDGVVEEMGM